MDKDMRRHGGGGSKGNNFEKLNSRHATNERYIQTGTVLCQSDGRLRSNSEPATQNNIVISIDRDLYLWADRGWLCETQKCTFVVVGWKTFFVFFFGRALWPMLSLVIVMVLLWQVFHMHISINCRMTLLPALHLFKWTTTRDRDDNWKWSWNRPLNSSTFPRGRPRSWNLLLQTHSESLKKQQSFLFEFLVPSFLLSHTAAFIANFGHRRHHQEDRGNLSDWSLAIIWSFTKRRMNTI